MDASTKLLKILAKAKRLPNTPDGAKHLSLEDKKNDNIEQFAIEDTKNGTKDATNDEIEQGPSEDMDMNDTNERRAARTQKKASDSSGRLVFVQLFGRGYEEDRFEHLHPHLDKWLG